MVCSNFIPTGLWFIGWTQSIKCGSIYISPCLRLVSPTNVISWSNITLGDASSAQTQGSRRSTVAGWSSWGRTLRKTSEISSKLLNVDVFCLWPTSHFVLADSRSYRACWYWKNSYNSYSGARNEHSASGMAKRYWWDLPSRHLLWYIHLKISSSFWSDLFQFTRWDALRRWLGGLWGYLRQVPKLSSTCNKLSICVGSKCCFHYRFDFIISRPEYSKPSSHSTWGLA